jgi:general secretion pathway protein A
MYAAHFDLHAEPFGLTPDPAYLFRSKEHQEALAAIHYGLLDARGFISLVGEVGTGKTTLLYSLLSQLDTHIEAAYVAYTTQSFEDLLVTALRDLGVECTDKSKHALLGTLNAHLQKRADEGRTTALIIDEAQNLSDQTFEELRLLSNFETYERKLLQIVLVGQPELQERLLTRQLRQLHERVSVRAFINPLRNAEMERYVAHRLALVGGSVERLFSASARWLLIRHSAGIPRRANILFHNSLLFAYGRNEHQVTAATAREVIAEMNQRRPGLLGRRALRRARRPIPVGRWAARLAVAVAGLLIAERVASRSLAVGGAPAEVMPAASPPASVAVVPPPPSPPATPPAEATLDTSRPELTELDAPPEPSEEPSEETVVAALPAPPPAADLPSATREEDPIEVVIPPGTTLIELLNDLYGQRPTHVVPPQVFEEVLQLNPSLSDVDVIVAGETLLVPAHGIVKRNRRAGR